MSQRDLASELSIPAPWFMGIVNLTPDSFSDGGCYPTTEAALAHARELVDSGAAILDIGGESTRPGSVPISAEEELRRIEPLVRELAPHAFVSIDTYKASVARRCLELGARMINDTSALRADEAMANVVREHSAYLVLMHSKATGKLPHATRDEKRYTHIVKEVAEYLSKRIEVALAAGIAFERVIVDPGFGAFLSHDPNDSWTMLAALDTFQRYGITSPILVGLSRKGFLGGELNERDPISQLAALAAVRKGASIVRTHHVRMARDFVAAWGRVFPGDFLK